ncbi:MAG: spheroidene monooxygenase [Pseudorhodobacter sp.]|nr:spheroidene monooxygenase [Rhizobacter sp.]
MRPLTAGTRSAGSVVVVVLVDFKPEATWWGWSRLVMQRWPLRRISGLKFSKVLGSGFEGGFGLRPSRTRQGLFLGFESEASARDFVNASPLLTGYRAHARELCVVMLRVCSCRGSWSGASLEVTAELPADGPVVSLTRASIRPSRARQFWRMQPASELSLHSAPGVLMATGVGEAPLLRQATFTLWESVAAMNAYARSGAHQEAIQAAYGGGYFSESMFARFVPMQIKGTWQGRHYV